MANIVIEKIMGSDFIRVNFNDVETAFEYVDIFPEQLTGLSKLKTGTIAVAIWDGNLWNLSVDGQGSSHQVDSVAGNTPLNNDELLSLIRELRPKLQ